MPLAISRDAVQLPATELAQLRLVRDRLLVNIADAAKSLGAQLDGDLELVIKRIRDSDYDVAVIEREVSWLSSRHGHRLGGALAAQVQGVASLVTRYEGIVAAGGRGLLSGSEAAFLVRHGEQTVKAAVAQDVLLNSPPIKTPAGVKLRFGGDRILKERVRPWKQARVLSKDFHGKAIKAGDDITSQALAAVRESKQLTSAASDMIREVRKVKPGAELGKDKRLSRAVLRVEKAGKALNQRGGPEALAEWGEARRRLRRYMRRLSEGGRTKSSLLELLQRTSDTSAKGIDRAIRQQVAFEQKYAAERILKTEAAASFKSAQILQDRNRDWIVGYWW
jgi:hypothetical protein